MSVDKRILAASSSGNDDDITIYCSLTPVWFFDFSVDEQFMTPEQFQRRDETIVEEEVLIEGQTISLDESVADNLLLAIPLQVLTEEEKQGSAMPSGNDWAVLSEEDFANQKKRKLNKLTRLAKLSELFNESDDDNA